MSHFSQCARTALAFLAFSYLGTAPVNAADTLRIATFNVSMEATNYLDDPTTATGSELFERLADGEHPQIRGIAEIIQRVRPDILLLNEFDYSSEPERSVLPFLQHYLGVSQQGQAPVDYPYWFQAPVNTGVDSGHDLDNDGSASGIAQDAFGYGLYPGHYGMLLLSRYPIDTSAARTFQHFLWRDMPGGLLDDIRREDGSAWYRADARAVFRLSSKSHWDIPIEVPLDSGPGHARLHVLASHPTPPGFDGEEDRNGRRNHDEIRLWADYIGAGVAADYLYDDRGHRGGLAGERFVVLGDLNASVEGGSARPEAIAALLGSALIDDRLPPRSEGAVRNRPDDPGAARHTASWGMRADYVLPSRAGWRVRGSGVFWPAPGDPLQRLVASRAASSDHRLVWVDLELEPLSGTEVR